jgi:hypothetical protein
MTDPSRALVNALFPVLLLVFLGLYVAGILAGVEPEFAMLRAGLASVILAIVGRFAIGMLDNLPPAVPVEKDPTPEPASSSVEKE